MLKKILISLLVIVLIFAGVVWGGVYYYLSKMPREEVSEIVVTGEDQELLKENSIPTSTNSLGTDLDVLERLARDHNNYKNVTNILLLGIDSEDGVGRSDAMMILTVDKNNQKIKLTSLIRDSYVYIAGRGMDKLNHAYAFGGSSLALRAVNTNFDMNIEDFVTVNFNDIIEIVDTLGGLDVKLSSEEARIIGVDGKGTHHLDGAKTLRYARIRSTAGGDFKRTSRQREVITLILDKLMALSPGEMISAANTLLPMVKTSLDSNTIIGLGSTAAINKYSVAQNSFPEDETSEGVMIKGIYYLQWDKDYTIDKLHNFIFKE